MSRLIKSNKKLLEFLATAPPKERKIILKNADKQLVHSICECVHNILRGNIPLTPAEKTKLKKRRTTLRKLVTKKSLAHKKKILVQGGGSLVPLILTPILTGLLQNLFR